MTLIYCSECGTQISDQAYACPKCGHRMAQPPPLQPMAMVPATPFYFSTPFIIICLLFCPLVGLILMWVGRVWPTWVRAAVTSVQVLIFFGLFFLWFVSIKVASDRAGQQMQMIIEEMQNIQPPPNFNPEQYYEEMERGGYSDYEYEESEPQITPSTQQTGSQIELGLWTWVNETSPEGIKIEGSVKNNSTAAFEGLKAYVTAEDATGLLLGVGSAPLTPSMLPAGGTSRFVVRITGAQCTTDSLSISCRFEY